MIPPCRRSRSAIRGRPGALPRGGIGVRAREHGAMIEKTARGRRSSSAQTGASRKVQVKGTPRRNPRNSGGSPSGVRSPAAVRDDEDEEDDHVGVARNGLFVGAPPPPGRLLHLHRPNAAGGHPPAIPRCSSASPWRSLHLDPTADPSWALENGVLLTALPIIDHVAGTRERRRPRRGAPRPPPQPSRAFFACEGGSTSSGRGGSSRSCSWMGTYGARLFPDAHLAPPSRCWGCTSRRSLDDRPPRSTTPTGSAGRPSSKSPSSSSASSSPWCPRSPFLEERGAGARHDAAVAVLLGLGRALELSGQCARPTSPSRRWRGRRRGAQAAVSEQPRRAGRAPAGQQLLAAISCGAVFMGANTYIGNGPNFMVKAIAEEHHVRMPSFFGYIAWSGASGPCSGSCPTSSSGHGPPTEFRNSNQHETRCGPRPLGPVERRAPGGRSSPVRYPRRGEPSPAPAEAARLGRRLVALRGDTSSVSFVWDRWDDLYPAETCRHSRHAGH